MQKTQKSRWLVDAILFSGFIAAFFLNLTGLAVHQWLGLAVFAMAIYHLFDHDAWVNSVTGRFFGKLAARSRLYYLLDAALMVGLAAITATGLVISSWLNLTIASYEAWLVVHITASIATLLVTVVKLALHWRWIVLTTKSIFFRQSTLKPRPTAGAALLGRREFVRLMGVVGVSSGIALVSSVKSLQASGDAESGDATNTTSISPSSARSAPGSASTSSTCSARCRRGCSYPGHCRKYTDANGNGRCDLGECA